MTDLTERESEVLALIQVGKHNPEIARLLEISTNTVKWHVGNILIKTGTRSRTEVAVKLK
jgi:DNA-binding NarL/FixJ family response regulator